MGKITSLFLSLVLVAGIITIVSPFPLDDTLASGEKKKNGPDRDYDNGKDRDYDNGKDRDYDNGKDRDEYKQFDNEYDREYMKYQPDYDTGEEYYFSDSY